MTNQILRSLLIEGKQHVYDMLRDVMKAEAQAYKEAKTEAGLDDDEKGVLSNKEAAIWALLDELDSKYERHIEEVNERYPCEDCLNTSTGYVQNLPNGWTQS